MPAQYSRADSLREYLTGAGSDGAHQSSATLSLGGYRSDVEAVSLGIAIGGGGIPGVSVLYADGANPAGAGVLTAIDANHLTWRPFGAVDPGSPTNFSGVGDVEVVEAKSQPGQYLRISGTTPFTPGSCVVTLSYLYNNAFSGDDVTIAQAASGVSIYRATIVKNQAASTVQSFQRWLATLGTSRRSDVAFLSGSGSGTIGTSSSGFTDWPSSGWCQIFSSGGTLKELVYYTSRTNSLLTVPAIGRGLLTTSATAGSALDRVYPVSGVAIGIDPSGVYSGTGAIQLLAGETVAPVGVTWNIGLTAATGLQIGSLTPGQLVGLWTWRQSPPGIVASPQYLTRFMDSFNAQ